MTRLKAIFVLDSNAYNLVYGCEELRAIAKIVDVLGDPMTADQVYSRPDRLKKADILFSGWGSPVVDEAFLNAAPKLKIVFYAAGSIGYWSTPQMFERGVRVTTASYANSVPVSEYTLAAILFSLKHGWRLSRETRRQRRFVGRDAAPGNFRSVVGLVSMGVVARMVLQLLKPFDLKMIAYDPFLSEAEANLLGVRKVSLSTLFEQSDAISIHAPDLEETRGMISGSLIASMKTGATLINTSRGRLIRQNEMIAVLSQRPDLHAILDVTDPEPPTHDSPLFDLENVTVTPHIAGSAGKECRRMGQQMVQELGRFIAGEPLSWEITRAMTHHSSHRSVIHVKSQPVGVEVVA